MILRDGWFQRQAAAAKETIKGWSQVKREVMLCYGGRHHAWGESVAASQTQEIQTCQNCDRQRIKFTWAEDWTMVQRGSEAEWCKSR